MNDEQRTKGERIMTRVEIKIPNWLDRICAWPVVVYRKWKYGYSYRRIYLDEGLWTIVDVEDYYRFGCFKWYIDGRDGRFYAIRGKRIGTNNVVRVRLHREIMEAPKGLLVDHRNFNGLDNRQSNLRIATHGENIQNRRKRRGATSRFIGVSIDNRIGKWRARIMYKGKTVWLGNFYNDIEAAKAYDAAAKKYYGEFARLNFPEESGVILSESKDSAGVNKGI
jgi:hypothetical protein